MVTFDNETRNKNMIKGIFVIILYFVVSLFKDLPLALLHIDYENLSILAKEIYSVSIEVVLIIIIIMVFKEQFKKALTDLKRNHLKYFSSNLKYYILGVAIMMISNSLIMLLGGSTSDNETAVRSQFELAPIYTFISAVIFAPIVEESVFRLSFRNIFKNNFLFIIISGIVFGGLHLLGMFDSNLFFLYLIAYSCMGFAFAYIMIKTNNILVSMGFHFMHNGILLSLQLFVLLFG